MQWKEALCRVNAGQSKQEKKYALHRAQLATEKERRISLEANYIPILLSDLWLCY